MPLPSQNSSLSPQEFVTRWKQMALTERASSQSHFIDLCRLLGQPTPTEADPTGDTYAFERGVTKSSGKSTGRQGWADVWKRGYFAWEYKGKHGNLTKAYEQLQQYREALENPPLLVVCDLSTIEIHTNFTNTVKQITRLSLEDLLDPHKLDILRRVFSDPEALRVNAATTAEVTEKAASEFAKLGEVLRRRGADPTQAAHFLIRLLFCLFAEDIGLLPPNLFSRLVENSKSRPYAVFEQRLGQLFAAMRTGGSFGSDDILYFNGGLFDDDRVLDLGSDGLEILNRASKLDWSAIEPAILGTLFERTLDPAKRAQLGAHYTSRADILLIVEPVLMSPLRRKWQEEIQPKARELANRRDSATSAAQRTRFSNELASLLPGFADEVAQVQVLDPACGSGNFLYVALKQLLDLQKEVVIFGAEMGLSRFFPSVSPQQLHGIEVNEYAHELAQCTIWIGYIQWLRDNGFGQPDEPILKPIKSIVNMDAVLAFDEAGKPREPEWPKADIIIGNPPFLGDKKMRTELGNKYVEDLRGLYGSRIPGQSDLVCYRFEKARALIETKKVQRTGLIATQGIRGGANRTVLERIKQVGDIFFAYSDRNWILDGANVHVSLVGFDGGKENYKTLNGQEATFINSDLTSKADISSAARLEENAGLSFIGTQRTGPFDLSEQQAQQMLSATGNPNGRSNSDVIKPWINALDVTKRPRNMWIIDFGINMSVGEASEYEAPFEYVKVNVKPVRAEVHRKNHREKWWLFGETRPGMRKTITNLTRFIVVPMVSKYKVFVWIPKKIIPENLLVVIARDDDYFFGVLHSKVHELWARGQGTQLREAESGTRYTPTTTFETFPFPWPPGKEPQGDAKVEAIGEAARELDRKRDNWLNPPDATEAELKKRTLTNLYNQRPTWLDLAHRKLDKAVLEAYGWPQDLSDEQILERLLALNLERASRNGNTLLVEPDSKDNLDETENA